ncbi:MAG: GntR family transcriptional regulator [Planctomycetaceae bacterium]
MPPTLGVKAYEELRSMLAHGRLEPGTQLVNRKLADEIGMSMTPVREAVTRLASEGLVEHVPGAGAFVRRISRQELAELYDVRQALEPLAAACAAQHATAAETAEMREIVTDSFRIIRGIAASTRGHADTRQMTAWLEGDRRFHEIVFRASRNRWLSKIAIDLKLLAFGFSPQRRLPHLLTVAAAVTTWRSHRRLLRALARRDGAAAERIVREHVVMGKKEVFSRLTADGDLQPTEGEAAPGRPRQQRPRTHRRR